MQDNKYLVKIANKSQGFEDFFVRDVYERLKELFLKYKSDFLVLKSEIIKFPVIFAYFSYLGYTKKEGWEIIKRLENLDLIERVPFHGIRFKVDNNGK